MAANVAETRSAALGTFSLQFSSTSINISRVNAVYAFKALPAIFRNARKTSSKGTLVVSCLKVRQWKI